jgi:hypothetical protein
VEVIVLLPLGVDDDALDRCLAALDQTTPAGTSIWLADDAQAGPRAQAVVEHWLAQTALQAEYTRRARALGEAAHLDEMLQACLARDASIATATPWSNAGEAVAWPRVGEVNPLPSDPVRLTQALSAMPLLQPELPSAVTHAVLIRGSARRRAGGLDIHSYHSWYAALVDLSLRMSGLGWRNVLCDNAFVGRQQEGRLAEGDMDVLANRWPTWTARLAGFLMDDTLRAHRELLQTLCEQAIMPQAQRDLFEASGSLPGAEQV